MNTDNKTDEQIMRDALERIAAVLREGKPRGTAATAYSIALTALSLTGRKGETD